MKKSIKTLSLFLIMALLFSLVGCNKVSVKEGKYTSSAPGYHGNLDVTTTIDKDGKVTEIAIGENHETKGVGSIAIEKIPQKIIETQSLAVDAISGATLTSEGIKAAVAASVESAGGKAADFGYVPVVPEPELNVEFKPETMPEKQPITDTITITDVKGREVSIDLPISSYALSTMDAIDYVIPLLGEDAFHKLVASGQDGGGGIERYARLYMPVVGNYMEHFGQISEHNAPFDLEMILAMDPDVLIINSAMKAHIYALEVEEQLTEAGIPFVLIDVPGKAIDKSAQQTLTLLGKIFQKEDRAAEVVEFLDEQYALIDSMNFDEADKPKVYYEKSASSEIFGSTSTSLSGWGLLIDMAGGDNIADPVLIDAVSGKSSGNTLDPEYVIETNPEFVITSGGSWMDNHENATPKATSFDVVNRTGWSELQAVKDGNVYGLSHAMSRSIYSFYAVLEMASIFHPDKFTDIDPQAVLDEFFDRFMLTDSSVTVWIEKYDGAGN